MAVVRLTISTQERVYFVSQTVAIEQSSCNVLDYYQCRREGKVPLMVVDIKPEIIFWKIWAGFDSL